MDGNQNDSASNEGFTSNEGSTNNNEGFNLEKQKRMSYIHESVFITFLMVYSIWRWCKSSFKNTDAFKSMLRVLGSFLILLSIFSSTIYNFLLMFLSSKFEIDKYEFELIGYSKYKTMWRNVNLFELLNVSYLFSKVLRISSLYMLIGLWGPCLYSFINQDKFGYEIFRSRNINSKIYISKDVFKTSIITFAKVYSLLRIPVCMFLYFRMRNLETSSIIFFESLFHGLEIYLCIVLMLVLKTRHGLLSSYKGMDTVTLLGVCLGFFGFFTYSLNSISVPFTISDTIYQVKQSLMFGLKMVIDLLTISMFCPIKNQIFDVQDENNNNFFTETREPIRKLGIEQEQPTNVQQEEYIILYK